MVGGNAMTKPVIDALDALLNIRAGMSDSELMAKYNLSARGLQSLFAKLVRAGVIRQSELDDRPHGAQPLHTKPDDVGRDAELQESRNKPVRPDPPVQAVVEDIRSGMGDAELMQKYRLSAGSMQTLLEKLTGSGALQLSELDKRASFTEETVDVVEIIQKLSLDRARAAEAMAEVPKKCIACGAPKTAEYDECPVCGVNSREYRAKQTWQERKVHAVWACPACGRPQEKEYDECPVCGVIVSKYKKTQPDSESTRAGEDK
jgi:rubrerythrin